MDTSEDGFSTAGGGRSLRETKARKISKDKKEAELNDKRKKLEELEKVEEGNRSSTQRKQIAKLQEELDIAPTSTSVDPQSKPQYPEPTFSDSERGEREKLAETPGSGDRPSPENERPSIGDRKGKALPGSQPTQTAPTVSPRMTEEGRVAVAYCRSKSFGKPRKIYRYGPPSHSKIEFGPLEAHGEDELAGLPLISGKRKTILDVQEAGRWLYGFCNIKKVVSVATLTPDPHRKWKPRITNNGNGKAIHVFPMMLVGILWDKIQPKHQQEYLKDGESFIFRGKLMQRLNKKDKLSLNDWLRKAAAKQDLSYKEWLNETGVTGRDRPPTFFPDADWANAPVGRKAKSQSMRTKINSKNSVPGSQVNGSVEEEDRHPDSKRQSANSGENSESMQKPRTVSASTEEPTMTKKRRRSDDNEDQGLADTTKKAKYVPKPQSGWIDRESYLTDMMVFYKLDRKLLDNGGKTKEQIARDTQRYKDGKKEILDGWEDYKKNMLDQGYKELG
jgi:hypothetical protein